MRKDHITPYIHIVVCHTVQLLREHGALGLYGQQGLEHSQKVQTAIFHKNTNKGGGRGLVTVAQQIMRKLYRQILGRHIVPIDSSPRDVNLAQLLV